MVWRRVLVPTVCTFSELHGVIPVATNWRGIRERATPLVFREARLPRTSSATRWLGVHLVLEAPGLRPNPKVQRATLRPRDDVPRSMSADAAWIEMTQPGLGYSPPSCSSRLSRAAFASASRGVGSWTATPGGTASPGSMSEFRRLLEAEVLGFAPRVAAAACEAAFFSKRAISPSNSAIRAADDLATRFVSRLLARSVALARSSFSTCARNSSLLSFGARGSAARVGFGAAAALVDFDARPFTAGFAEAAGGRPGLRPLAVRWPISADLAVRAMMSSPLNGLEGSPRWQGATPRERRATEHGRWKTVCGLDLEACGGERAYYVPVAVRAAPLPRIPSATRCTGGASRSSSGPGLRPSPISLARADRRAAYFGATIG